MTLITDTQTLAELCARLTNEEFVTVDTEFIREKTYWPVLCLIQLAGENEAAAVDTLAAGIDLSPIYALMQNPDVIKVFHASRQDIEIFVEKTDTVPTPLFDTQLAAMVCGFGDQVGYETLVRKITNGNIDKSARFTDWARRPLTEKQLHYALSDVTHLRDVYRTLRDRLTADGRAHWLKTEMKVLNDPSTYKTQPDEAWVRLKTRSPKPKFLAVLREIAAVREQMAQNSDVPRGRIVRDDALMEIASSAPQTIDDLERVRGISTGAAKGKLGGELVSAVKRALASPKDSWPVPKPKLDIPPGAGPVIDLLKVLLKLRCEEQGVAQKLIASMADLESIAISDHAPVPALEGWRREIFGEDALALKHGRLALTITKKGLTTIPTPNTTDGSA